MSENKKFALELSVLEKRKVIAKQVFDQDKIVIGRILSADFRIPSPQVSRIHALLEFDEEGHLKFTDLASSHGSFVNGKRIVECRLSDGDKIKIADLELKFNVVALEEKAEEEDRVPTQLSVVPLFKKESKKAAQVAPKSVEKVRKKELTTISSLKETARSRGALDASAKPHDEMELTVYWEETVLAVDHFKKSRRLLSLGDGFHSDYMVPEQSFPKKFDFIKLTQGSAELRLHPTMKVSARIKGQMYSNDDLKKSGQNKISLEGNDIAKIKMGTMNFFLMFVPEPPPLPRAPVLDQGKLYWGLLATLALITAVLVSYGYLLQGTIQGQVKEFPEKFRKIIVKNYKKKKIVKPKAKKKELARETEGSSETDSKQVEKPVKTVKTQKESGSKEGARSKGAEGKKGSVVSKKKAGQTVSPKSASKAKKSKEVAKPRKKPQKVGLLESLKNSNVNSRLAKLTQNSGSSSLNKAFSGVGGAQQSARGSGAQGALRGSGTGGGGSVSRAGGLGTQGFAKGAGGTGSGSLPGKGEARVSSEGGGIAVGGGMSKAEIDRVVRAHFSEVRFCLIQARQRVPGLSGKIALAWTIGYGGVVTKTRTVTNTTGNRALADCIRKRLRQWRFPSPPRGGSVEVEQFPFVLGGN